MIRKLIWIGAVLIGCAHVAYGEAWSEPDPDSYGQSVRLDGRKVTIDRSFLDALEKNPTAEEWQKNRWEFIYFINKGDERAVSIGIDVLMNIRTHRASTDDHIGVKNIAMAISSYSDLESLLCKKPVKTQKAILEYYKKYRADYIFGYDAPWTMEWCKGK